MNRIGKTWPLGVGAALATGLMALYGCGVGFETDREEPIVTGIRVDSVILLPTGSRFLLQDSTTRFLFRKFRPGYACSEILTMDIDSIASGNPAAYPPLSRVRLPAAAECALDTTGRDTLITHVFRNDASKIRFANSAGVVTDSARVVAGVMTFDSLEGVFSGVTRAFSSGHYSVVDSGGGRPRSLYVDTLACGQYLNQVGATARGDTLKVRLSIVTLDSPASLDSCLGATHDDSVAVGNTQR